VLSLPTTIGLALILGVVGWLGLVGLIFGIVSSGLMIYLIGETD